MPTISAFYGIRIRMHWDDHAPPHFHARYAGAEVTIDIQTLAPIRGTLPRHAMLLVLEWARLHQDELRENWLRCTRRENLTAIPPLP
jgi:hypothetical protein